MKKIVIIGGGISGLAAGIYAQQYGFESEIYEKHSITGGQCTGWDRNGIHTDGCIHWLTGSKKGTELYDEWVNCGVLGGDVNILSFDNFGIYYFKEATITLWTDLERLRKEWYEISPEDKEETDKFIDLVKACESMSMPVSKPMSMMKLGEIMKLGMSMKDAGAVMSTYAKISCKEYGEHFKHPAIRKLFINVMPEEYAASSFLFSYATLTSGDGGIPEKGSRAMAERMQKRYEELGGKVYTGTPVQEIVIEKNTAVGIKLNNGEMIKSDYVIPACDIKFTFDKLLKGRYHDKVYDVRFADPDNNPSPTCVLCSYAVDADLSELPRTLTFETDRYKVGASEFNYMSIINYDWNKQMNTSDKTSISVIVNQNDKDFYIWKDMYKDNEKYKTEKKRISDELMNKIVEKYPQFKDKITAVDVATPITYERYANAYHGAWMSFMMVPGSKQITHSGKIKGLKNCWLSGQWLMTPGGLPCALATGKFAVMNICKLEKMPLN